jgi:hypothetical protein
MVGGKFEFKYIQHTNNVEDATIDAPTDPLYLTSGQAVHSAMTHTVTAAEAEQAQVAAGTVNNAYVASYNYDDYGGSAISLGLSSKTGSVTQHAEIEFFSGCTDALGRVFEPTIYVCANDKSVQVPLDNLRYVLSAPRVTGTGSSGDWHWRIWSDGRRELWGRLKTKISYAGQSGDNYLSDPSTVGFPFTFTSVADLQFTGQCREYQLMATDCTTSSFTWRGWSWWPAPGIPATLNVYVDGTV